MVVNQGLSYKYVPFLLERREEGKTSKALFPRRASFVDFNIIRLFSDDLFFSFQSTGIIIS